MHEPGLDVRWRFLKAHSLVDTELSAALTLRQTAIGYFCTKSSMVTWARDFALLASGREIPEEQGGGVLFVGKSFVDVRSSEPQAVGAQFSIETTCMRFSHGITCRRSLYQRFRDMYEERSRLQATAWCPTRERLTRRISHTSFKVRSLELASSLVC